ncbi:MAG: tetratricopeptide repeat protein [Anaerolineae bacterium]|nr:tetratricopeptide repeat protein [Anaerolineae bacterium]
MITLDSSAHSVTSIQRQIDDVLAEASNIVLKDLQQGYNLSLQAETLLDHPTFVKEPYRKGRADLLFVQGTVHFHRGKYDLALNQLRESVQLFTEINDPHGLAKVLNLQASVYRTLGDYTSAAESFSLSLNLAESTHDVKSQLRALCGLSSVSALIGDHKGALNYLDGALILVHEANDPQLEAKILNNVCVEATALKDYENAMTSGQTSLRYFLENALYIDAVDALVALAHVHHELGDVALALRCLYQAADYAEMFELHERRIDINLLSGEIYLKLNQPKQAKQCFQSALKLAETSYSKRALYTIHQNLSLACKGLGEYERALHHLERYVAIRDQLASEAAEQKIRNLEIKFRTEQARQEADLYRLRTRELEQLRQQDRAYFERLSKIKDDFINDASHDLKNPLSRILIYLNLLRRHGHTNDERGQEYVDQISRASQLMQSLIADLLDIARLETANTSHFTRHPINVLLQSSLAAFSTQAADKRQQLTLTPISQTLMAYCDPLEIERAVQNLLSNAVKFTPSGGNITIAADNVNEYVRITIADTGPGIPPEDIPHLFQRFYRGTNSRLAEGTGLGLAIVKLIVENHGGKVGVDSQLGHGTRFWIMLPKG